eukprot:scaffold9837_cov94-Isochrysis_galbana.AAC.3
MEKALTSGEFCGRPGVNSCAGWTLHIHLYLPPFSRCRIKISLQNAGPQGRAGGGRGGLAISPAHPAAGELCRNGECRPDGGDEAGNHEEGVEAHL